ncbi:MAG: T9SS type A sorting domain-containing protein [Flavobacteriales bacterium]|nr:T9SS type A sorting domain-containing protein [Flavobacteriales bacterium]
MPTTYLNNPAICNPLASAVLVGTTYTVTATNAAGCSSTGTIAVTVQTLDTDGDLTVDCLDGCPLDANKIVPGQCGCGVADTDTDGDLTADCNDGCINDPLKIAPGICGCGVADTDTDGDLTADCNDLCPIDPNKIVPGQCGCGVADTDTDSDLIADCVDNCPSVPGVVGTPCNDNDVNTINDQLTALCVCAGTVPTCAFNTVLIDLTTDNSGAETTWDVVNVGTTTQVCSGSGYLNNQVITLDCCLPNGCYELRFFDSAGDGMANGTVGGYVLRSSGSGNKRIIDNGGDGIFTSTSQIASNLGFCVPISADVVIPSHCDKINWLPTDIIQATANPAVTGQFGVTNSTSGYWFWFFNPDGGYTRRILQTHAAPGSVTGAPANVRSSYLRLSDIVTQPIPFFTNLNVRVRTQVAGVVGAFGPACRFKVDPPCATTQLTNLADPVVSCGATGLTLSSTIYAANVVGATKYQFEFTRPGYLRRIANSTRSTILGFTTLPLTPNTCYNVRVRVSFDGGLTYCSFGTPCTITLGVATCPPPTPSNGSQGDGEESEHSTSSTSNTILTMWPNPNDGTLVNISLNEFDASVNSVGVEVMDMHGRMVSTRTIPVDGGTLNTVLPFEQTLAPGLYLVNVQVGETRYTERLVIQ